MVISVHTSLRKPPGVKWAEFQPRLISVRHKNLILTVSTLEDILKVFVLHEEWYSRVSCLCKINDLYYMLETWAWDLPLSI